MIPELKWISQQGELQEVYAGRLDTTESEIIKMFDNIDAAGVTKYSRGFAEDLYGHYVNHFFVYARNFTQAQEEVMDKDWEKKRDEYCPVFVDKTGYLNDFNYLAMYWSGNRWIHEMVFHREATIGGEFHYSGHVELTRTYPTKEKPIDIVVYSSWPATQPFWTRLALELRSQFKEKRKGGANPTPEDKQIQAVLGYRDVLGKMPKEVYCANSRIPVSPRQLSTWEAQLEAKGLIQKRKRR